MSIKLLITSVLLGFHLMVAADDVTPHYQLINNESYPTQDMAVATLNVMDYGADPTGQIDQTKLFQKLLDKLADVDNPQSRGDYRKSKGGILYVPAGRYLFKGQLVMPTGVSMRGDWRKPEVGESIEGTILAVDYGEGSANEEQAFILMQPSTEVSHLAFWYPNQKMENVKVFPPTIHYGQKGVWGNEYCNARYITMVNSYIGIQFCTDNGGGCPNIFHLYGTPLYKGVQIDCLADVGRFDHISFSPSYWSDSQLPDAPSKSAVAAWLRQEATGFVMRRNDWSYTCNLEIEGYHVGFLGESSPQNAATKGTPNGHNYGWTLRNCQTAVSLAAISGAGIRFTRVNTPGCDVGIHLKSGATGNASFYKCNIEGQQALLVDADACTPVILTDCTVDGETFAQSGQLVATGNQFCGNVTIGSAARTVYTGNTLLKGAKLVNNSLFECAISDRSANLRSLPTFQDEWFDIPTTKPTRAALYVVTDAEFGAKPFTYGTDISKASDCTQAIEKALNKASQEGGGIVYLPAGHYRMNGRLNIPTNVELKGASDLASVPRGQGAILEVLVDEGNAEGQPFITMSPQSGLRGITVNYPHQENPKSPIPHPYTVRGNADCYIVNLALRTAYRGIDLFTNDCSRHYVDYVAGHAFRNVIRIGGNSKGGIVSNIQCNTIAYACGNESKYGSWPNSAKMAEYGKYAYSQNQEQLDFLVIGDCSEEVLYNNFLYGCNQGLVFQDDGKGGAKNVKALGNAVDGAMYAIVVNGIGSSLDLVNSQLVALNHKDNIIEKSFDGRFITIGSKVKYPLSLLGSDNWGSATYYALVQGGTLRMQQAHLSESGATNTFDITGGGEVYLTDGHIQGMKALVAKSGSMESKLFLQSAVIDMTGAKEAYLKAAINLLPTSWELNPASMLSRDGWKATASANNQEAQQAIDGDESSRWSTGSVQKTGQWLSIDMRQAQTFNTLILDTSNSKDDGPASYKVEVASKAGDWKEVASGSNGGAVLVVSFPIQTARYLRITQTGSKSGNYWSVHELYIAKAEQTPSTGIVEIISDKEGFGSEGFYTLSGQAVQTPSYPGIYIDKKTHKKVLIK